MGVFITKKRVQILKKKIRQERIHRREGVQGVSVALQRRNQEKRLGDDFTTSGAKKKNYS